MRVEQSRRFVGFDILKFLCAFLIVCIHNPFPGIVGEYFTSLTRIAVPIFFMITGFFYVNIVDRKHEWEQIRKIFRLVIEANLLYLLWKCFCAAINGIGVGVYISQTFSVKNIAKFLALNESPFNGHLWYLGAILYVLLIVFVAKTIGMKKIFYVLTPFLLAGDLILGKYSLLLFHREFPYIVVRNFLFVGLPYFCIGELLRNWKTKIEIRKLVPLVALLSCTSVLERFLLIRKGLNATRDHYISTTFLAVVFFLLFKEVYSRHRVTVIEKWAAKIGRDYSTWIYIIHPIFITVTGEVMRKIGLYEVYQYIAPMLIYSVSIVFVMIVTEGMKRIKYMRKS